MTINEASERYGIPLDILHEYKRWGLCGAVKKAIGSRQHDSAVPGDTDLDDTDLERLSLIMTLHDIGFQSSEIETYMRLLLENENGEAQRLNMLNIKRRSTLDDIHFREKQLSYLDYLRYSIRKKQDINNMI